MTKFMRVSTILGKALLWILLCLVLLLVFVFSTNWGTRLLLTQILPVVGVKAEHVQGSLMSGLQAEHLSVKTASAEVAIKDLTLDIAWRRLFDKTVEVQQLSVGDLQVKLLPVEQIATVKSETPFSLPELPVDILLDSVKLGKFTLTQADGSEMPIGLGNIELSGIQWTADQATIDLNGLELVHDFSTTQLNGSLKLGELRNADLPIELVLHTRNATNNALSPLCVSPAVKEALKKDSQAEVACHLDLDIRANGNLRALDVSITGKGDDIRTDGIAKVNLFAPIPLESLQSTFHIENGLNIKADVQSVMVDDKNQKLNAAIQMQQLDLSGVLPKSHVDGSLQLEAQASGLEQWQYADIRLDIAKSSRWNGEVVQGKAKLVADVNDVFTPRALDDESTEQLKGWVLEALKLTATDVDFQVGANTIKMQGTLGQPEDKLNLDVRLPQMSKLYPAIGESAQLKGDIKGSLADHQLNLSATYKPAEGEGLGVSTIHLNLRADSQLKNILQALQWRANVQSLDVKHSGYHLRNQEELSVLVDTVAPLTWEVGQSSLLLGLPNGQETRILHQHSQQKNNDIVSEGRVENLALEKSRYNANWRFNKNPQMTAEIKLTRQGEERLGVQTNPLANVRNLLLTLTPHEQNDVYKLLLVGDGESTTLNADALLNLQTPLVLDNAVLDIELSDGTVLKGHSKIGKDETSKNHIIDVDLTTNKLALHKWTLGMIPTTVLNGDIKAKINLSENKQLLDAGIQASFSDDSVWNKQKLTGKVDVVLMQSAALNIPQRLPFYMLDRANIDLTIGKNRIFTQGAFGKEGDNLILDIQAPNFAEIYPTLTGGAITKGKLSGGLEKHLVDLEASYAAKGILTDKNPELMRAKILANGAWGKQNNQQEGWSGSIQTLSAKYQDYSVDQSQPLTLQVIPVGEGGLPEWNAGASTLNVTLLGKHKVDIQQQGASGKNGQWSTKGAIHGFVVNRALLDELDKLIGQSSQETRRGGVVVRDQNRTAVADLVFDIDWDIGFDKALKGSANIVRKSGDFTVPLAKPFTLGLQNLALHAVFEPKGGDTSQLNAQLLFDTQNKGNAKLTLTSAFKGLVPNLNGGTQLKAVGGIKDIAWASIFTDDLLTLGGAVNFDVDLKSTSNGQWQSSGFVNGQELRIVEVENGVRLLNGTLKASFNDNRVRIDTLYFPSVIRVVPSEWRTRQWIEENPPAQKGSLRVDGEWDLNQSSGFVKTTLDHYPIVQRADRFAMMSGDINITAALPKIDLQGKLTANAGWASIDIKDTIPSVDGDVIVLKPGQTTIETPKSNSSSDLNMNLTVDLGPRFYLVGMGLNSGLVGAINLVQNQGRLTAEGQFRTRGGAIEAYGQRLQIAKGEISFGGNITNPTLDIEAVRRGPEVEAGLRVIGTAKKPKITLVSYPEVSEVEKLSWLIMGRGPDSSGADLALLFSVGSSLIGGEEPFYRRIGIDEIGVRAGTVGDTDNILPERTVADSTAYRGYEDGNQLFYATKKFGEKWRVSVEQALAGSGTVVRGSYKLMRYITTDLKVGTVNGIELLYKRVFKD